MNPSQSQLQLIAAGAAAFVAGFTLRSFFGQPNRGAVIPSPRKNLLPKLSIKEVEDLPYPPDAYPGARSLETPFGTQQIFEFGPEDGRKVLCVHGISTPCVAMGGLAHRLVDKGCRVMLFDLPGRGWSDSPADLDHDIRLFMAAILMALASSPLAWTGKDGFSIVGYSLGGGISAGFTSYFPEMIDSIVLIAPAGLIREKHLSTTNKLVYARTLLFEPVSLWVTGRRLRKPIAVMQSRGQQKQPDPEKKVGLQDAVEAEVAVEQPQKPVLSKKYSHISLERAVNYQVDHHEGYVKAVLSSLRYAPILRQHQRWWKIGTHLKEVNKDALLILGSRDPIINFDETKEDVSDVLGGRVKLVVLETGHETCVARGDECAEQIWKFWTGNFQESRVDDNIFSVEAARSRQAWYASNAGQWV